MSANCLISSREGLVWVCLLWGKQQETHIVRKSTFRLGKFSSLVPILNEIEPFKNSKIYEDPAIHRSLIYFQILNSCILFNIGLIDTKREIFPKFRLCGSRVLYPTINGLVSSSLRFEIRQNHFYVSKCCCLQNWDATSTLTKAVFCKMKSFLHAQKFSILYKND